VATVATVEFSAVVALVAIPTAATLTAERIVPAQPHPAQSMVAIRQSRSQVIQIPAARASVVLAQVEIPKAELLMAAMRLVDRPHPAIPTAVQPTAAKISAVTVALATAATVQVEPASAATVELLLVATQMPATAETAETLVLVATRQLVTLQAVPVEIPMPKQQSSMAAPKQKHLPKVARVATAQLAAQPLGTAATAALAPMAEMLKAATRVRMPAMASVAKRPVAAALAETVALRLVTPPAVRQLEAQRSLAKQLVARRSAATLLLAA